jgi:histone H2A
MKKLKEAVPHGRFGTNAAVYTAAVLEYLCAELLEGAGQETTKLKRARITPSHILLASKI